MNGSLLRLTAISTLLIAVLFFVLTPSQGSKTSQAHALTEVSIEGLDLQAGTYTVLDFAASWCQPCYQALPQLQEMATAHPNLDFKVICVDEKPEDCDRLVSAVKLTLPVVWDGDHNIIGRFSPDAFPATYVLDENGRVLHHHEGTSQKAWRYFDAFLARLDPESE